MSGSVDEYTVSLLFRGQLGHTTLVLLTHPLGNAFLYFSVPYSHHDRQTSSILLGNRGSTLVCVILEAVEI